jgi:hypothetical protein
MFHAKNDAPVPTDIDCPKTQQIPSKLMEPPSGQIHVLGRRGDIESGQNASEAFNLIGWQAPLVVLLIKTTQPLVAEARNHKVNVTYNVSGINATAEKWTAALLHLSIFTL